MNSTDRHSRARALCIGAFCLALVMLSQGRAFPGEPGHGAPGDTRIEHYRYEAMPVGKEKEEDIEVSISFDGSGAEYVSRTVSAQSDERITIKMDREGGLISATRSLRAKSGGLTEGKIWRQGNQVYIENTHGGRKKTTRLDVPKGATPALEGSLLILLRFFPYGGATRWDLFMIDFSGRSVTAVASQAGIERIAVPAGEFSCYRVDIVIHLFILRPKVVLWVATEKPHFLVKSLGKRGIFSPKYVTALVAKQ